MDKYQNGKIYKIWDNGYNECYIGSTVEPLSKRMSKHRADYCRWKQGGCGMVTVYQMFDKYDVNNCKIELIERYPCSMVEELRAREGYWIRQEKCVNKRIERRTEKEYREDNKEKTAEYQKEYYNENKESFAEYKKRWYEDNKEQVKEYKHNHYIKNREEILDYERKYRQRNMDKIREYGKQYRNTCRAHLKECRAEYYKEHKEELLKKTSRKDNVCDLWVTNK